ncbi:MAG TPA: M28 family peptidase [Puia sp.]|jgi:Zn-dependent M28 family amino/carboxypeptidase|nr:M28 family peptidase [Puia sp.]
MKQLPLLLTVFLQLGVLTLTRAQTSAQSASQRARTQLYQDHIAAATPPLKAVAPLLYLASDQLKGRYIGRPEIDTAALYIANQFREAGAKTVPGATGYFQRFTHSFTTPVTGKSDTGSKPRQLSLRNVLAYVPGTDPKLRDQFIALTSHYDHLGVDPQPKMEEGKLDSIYNGARDNATGTAAVIDAARYFARYPSKRSILFITYTAEEEGLIGSDYYAAHPLVPIKQTVYNLNIDNASYDDTTLISLVGLHRTSEDSLIISACAAYGLTVNGDPTGGSLFYESDNTPLAQKGVPAPTYSLGMRAFDSTITNRYHRLSDETGNMDLHYVLKFIRAYILAAKYIADDAAQPRWTKGDEFEKAWLSLYPQ